MKSARGFLKAFLILPIRVAVPLLASSIRPSRLRAWRMASRVNRDAPDLARCTVSSSGLLNTVTFC